MMQTVDEVIAGLGGLKEAAERLGVGITAVSNWRSRGYIPAQHFFAIREAVSQDLAPAIFEKPKQGAAA